MCAWSLYPLINSPVTSGTKSRQRREMTGSGLEGNTPEGLRSGGWVEEWLFIYGARGRLLKEQWVPGLPKSGGRSALVYRKPVSIPA